MVPGRSHQKAGRVRVAGIYHDVAFEAAAMEVAARCAGTHELQVEEWDVHFVAPGTVGPFLVQADGNLGTAGRVVVRLLLLDEGRDDAVVTAGVAVFRAASTP